MRSSLKNFIALNLILFFACPSLAAALGKQEYKNIRSLIEEQNIERAFEEVKIAQAGKSKLSGYALLSLGHIYLELSLPNKASDNFEKVLFASTILDAEAKAGLSLSQSSRGNFIKAKALANEALIAQPDLIDAKIAYAIAAENEIDDDEIDNLFRSAMRASRSSTFAGRKYVELLIRNNRIKKAEEILKETLIKNSIDAPSLALYSEISWLKGEIETSIRYRTEAENAYRNAGNNIKADEMVAWLNIEAMPSVKQIEENKKVPKPEEMEVEATIVPDAAPAQIEPAEITRVPNRPLFEPLETPEDIPIDPEKGFYTGSGTILGNGHIVLTNQHVVEGVNYVVVRNGLGETRIGESFVTSETDDLAIIKLSEPFPSDYSFSIADFAPAQAGEEVYAMGYPMAMTLGMFHPSITEGIVTNPRGFGEEAGTFQMSAQINPGNSGGPIFNNQGQIVGVATGGLNKKIFFEEDGFIPNDVNYGVTTERVISFLEQPIPASLSTPQTYNAQTIYKYMRSAVVFIVGQE